MGKRLEIVTSSTNNMNEFQHAMACVGEAASKRMPDVHAVRPTPLRRTTTGNSSAFTPMVKLKPTKILDLPAALQDALRHAGVPLNQDNMEALQDTLVHTQLDRERKLHDHYVSASAAAHESLAERSSKADGDLRVTLDVLYKHTSFQKVNLTSPNVDERLKAMEGDVEDKNRRLVESEGNELSLSDPRVRAFIARYKK
jgi:hypothetical protein